jgi:hypothetical protein
VRRTATKRGMLISEAIPRAWTDPEVRERLIDSLCRAGAGPDMRKQAQE